MVEQVVAKVYAQDTRAESGFAVLRRRPRMTEIELKSHFFRPLHHAHNKCMLYSANGDRTFYIDHNHQCVPASFEVDGAQ